MTAAQQALQDAGKSAGAAYNSAASQVSSALDESGATAVLQDAGKKAGAALSNAVSDENLDAMDSAFGSALDSAGKALGSAQASAIEYLDSSGASEALSDAGKTAGAAVSSASASVTSALDESGATEALQNAGKSAGAALEDAKASVLSALEESGADQQIAEAEASIKAALNTSGVGAAYDRAMNNVLSAFADPSAPAPGTCNNAHKYNLWCPEPQYLSQQSRRGCYYNFLRPCFECCAPAAGELKAEASAPKAFSGSAPFTVVVLGSALLAIGLTVRKTRQAEEKLASGEAKGNADSITML